MLSYIYNLATDKYKGFIPSVIKVFLHALSIIYGLVILIIMFIRRIKPYRASCKVISVGNITLGGTGKTPLVYYIARFLSQNGKKVAVISRGYKRQTQSLADEPFLLRERLKNIIVIVDPNRKSGIEKAVKDYNVDTVILDDGFQQWGIKKDLEIVTIDAGNPFGNFKMIPRGILREPLSALKEADVFVFTKTDLYADFQGTKDYLKKLNPSALVFESRHNPVGFYRLGNPREILLPDFFQGRTAALFCGIADPMSFKGLIQGLGITIAASFIFADHYYYSPKDLDGIIKSAQEKNSGGCILTTEKDAARLSGMRLTGLKAQIFVLRVDLQILKDEKGFNSRLLKLYSA